MWEPSGLVQKSEKGHLASTSSSLVIALHLTRNSALGMPCLYLFLLRLELQDVSHTHLKVWIPGESKLQSSHVALHI